MSDDDLVAMARAGDTDAAEEICRRYAYLAARQTRNYWVQGGDGQDTYQEGMLGLLRAIECYRPNAGSSFRTFAHLCVRRAVFTAIKLSRRRKHACLNGYVSLEASAEGGEDLPLGEVVAERAGTTDPGLSIIESEELQEAYQFLQEVLTPFEWEVLLRRLVGETYLDTADRLGKSPKAIDNAIQRVRRKLQRYVAARSRRRS